MSKDHLQASNQSVMLHKSAFVRLFLEVLIEVIGSLFAELALRFLID